MSNRSRRWMSVPTWRAWGRLVRMRLRRNAAGHVVATTVAFVVFLASLWIIARELRGFAYAEVWAYLKGLPPTYVVLAFGLTTLTFVVLSGYDALALRYVGVDLPRKRILFSAFVGYAVSQALGNPILTGGAVRYRLYSLWGLPPAAVAKSILFAGLSFWLGFFALGGGVLLVNPDLLTDISPLPVSAPVLGALALAPVVMYAGGTWYRATPVTIWGWTLKVPPQWMLPVQVALAAGDLVLASSVVYVLLPPGTGVGLVQLLAAYLVALLAGLVSHVPGGLGVFESVMLLLLTPDVSAPILLGGLLAYRGIFHLLPLTLAALAFGAYEFWYGTSARTADPEAN